MEGVPAELALSLALLAGFIACMAAVFGYRGRFVEIYRAYRDQHRKRVGELLASMLSETTPEQFFRYQLMAAGAGFLVFAVLGGGGLAAFAGAALGYYLPSLKLKNDADVRRIRFENQLEDALISMSNTLKTSPTMEYAVSLVREAMSPPASEEFALVERDARLYSMDRALERLGDRMRSQDLNVVLAAIKVSQEVGANLSEMLHTIATTLREIKRLQGLIESKTAEGKMQAWVMGALPVFLGVALFFIDPKMITPLFTTNVGLVILSVVILFEVTGVYLIRRITSVDV